MYISRDRSGWNLVIKIFHKFPSIECEFSWLIKRGFSKIRFYWVVNIFFPDKCSVLGHYAASNGNFLPTFGDNLSVQSSRVLIWFLNPEELSSQALRSDNQKSRVRGCPRLLYAAEFKNNLLNDIKCWWKWGSEQHVTLISANERISALCTFIFSLRRHSM
jgi:hypothetical protein